MKRLLILAFIAASCSVQAATETKETPEERNESRLRRTGGFIRVEAKGLFVVFDGQSRISSDVVQKALEEFCKDLKISSVRKTFDKKFSISEAASTIDAAKATAALFVVDDETLPVAIAAPEDHWGVVNVAKLLADDSAAVAKAIRFEKELVRVASIVLGAWSSPMMISVLQPARQLSDIDRFGTTSVGPEAILAMNNYAEKIGFQKERRVTYRAACLQGWAPAPTNEYQKAVWDKVRATPKNPMKIEFDPKKGR